MRAAPLGLLCVLAVLSAPAPAAPERGVPGVTGDVLKGAPPPAGHYDAVMCVALGGASPNCGPVRADIGSAGQALVRVSDIAYRLEVVADQLGVTLFHGTMQIDGFFARYQWVGPNLQFQDPDKATRYELKLGARRFDTP